ncbi:MAG TPA: thiolase family protein [Myxococcales bacterium]|nr:thiolase family protein [Myxococcales bacterium]
MPNAVIVDAVRTARGKKKGSLAGTHPMDLAAHALKAALRRTKIEAKVVDDVVLGCVTQVGEQGLNIARGAVLAAGLPIEVAGTTVNRFCGSGLQAVNFAAQAIMAGQMDLAIGGGVESMTRVPMGSDAIGPGDGPASPQLLERWPNLVPQGLSAEMIAEKWKLSRKELDEFAAHSQQKAGAAIKEGKFKAEIDPVEVTTPDGKKVAFETDEHCRPGTTVEVLAGLKPSFKENGVIHAGNSSGIVDGAAAVVLASKERARSLGLKPRARVVAMGVAGSDPVLMLTGPIPAVQKALQRAELTVKDIDLWEINEAFAPVPIVVARELGIPLEKVNVLGGAIALGHPLGATGAILLTTVLNELERRDLRRACITLCIGYGMGVATVIDRKVD